jgi:predicted nucleic acid-binding protein
VVEQYKRPYFDSSVFIGWIKGEVIGRIDRRAVADHNFHLAQQKTFQIYTSAVTLAEVHKIRGKPGALDATQDEAILTFFEHEYIMIIDVDREIGEEANRHCRAFGLQPMDALHLACALRAQCDILLGWDDHFKSVTHPAIRCEAPQALGQLTLPGSSASV